MARFAIGMAFLAFATATDLRTRTVPNRMWAVVMPLALALLVGQAVAEGGPIDALLAPVMLYLLLPVFFEEGERTDLRAHLLSRRHSLAVASLSAGSAAAFILLGGDPALLLVPLLVVVVYVLYAVNLLVGGGDAKAMIAVVLLVPFHPDGWPDTLGVESIFPFPVVVLTNAILLFVVIPMALAALNLARRDVAFPEMFFGVRMDLKAARRSHVWPMERVVNGQRVLSLLPSRRDPDEMYRSLAKARVMRVWVTPKFPFMVALMMGFAAAFLLGDIMAWLVVRVLLRVP